MGNVNHRRVGHIISHIISVKTKVTAKPSLRMKDLHRLELTWSFDGGRGYSEEYEKALHTSYILDAGITEGLIRVVMESDKLSSDERESIIKMFIESIPRDMLFKVLNDMGVIGAGKNWGDIVLEFPGRGKSLLLKELALGGRKRWH